MQNEADSKPLPLEALRHVLSEKALADVRAVSEQIYRASAFMPKDQQKIVEIIAKDFDATDGKIDGAMHRITLLDRLDKLSKLSCNPTLLQLKQSLKGVRNSHIEVNGVAQAVSGFVMEIISGRISNAKCNMQPEFIPSVPDTARPLPLPIMGVEASSAGKSSGRSI